MNNERIGTTGKDGVKSYPKVDVNGAPYSMPATTVGIGAGRFVVIPAGFKDFALIEELKQPKPTLSKTKTNKKEEAQDDASE